MQTTFNTHTPYVPHWLLMLVMAVMIHGALMMIYGALTPQEGAADQGQKGIEVGLKVFSLPPKLTSPPPEAKVAVQKKTPPKPVNPVQKTVTLKPKPKPIPKPAPIIKPEPLVLEEPEPVDAEPIEETIIEEVVLEEKAPAEEPVVEEEIVEVATTVAPIPEAEIADSEPVTEGVIDSDNDTQQTELISMGGGKHAAQADYEATLLHWLEKHKRYPSIAKRRGQQDIVELSFSIDAQGNVLSYEIVNASAFKSLNKAVEKMIKRASPLPAVPMELANYQAQFSYVVPVQFELQ